MRALALAAAAALACGAAAAQDAATLCRSFCDTEAHECRSPTRSAGWVVADTLLHIHGSPSVLPDEHEQAAADNERERRDRSRQCGDARQVCRQKCAAPAAPAAVSAPYAATPAPAAASGPN